MKTEDKLKEEISRIEQKEKRLMNNLLSKYKERWGKNWQKHYDKRLKEDLESDCEYHMLKAELKGFQAGKREGMKMKLAEIYKQSNPEIDLLKTAQNNYEAGKQEGYKQAFLDFKAQPIIAKMKAEILQNVNKIIDERIKKNKESYKLTKPPEELDNLNIFKNRIEELELIKSQIQKLAGEKLKC